ncbi:MAG: hypothetical protein IJP93_06165 [Bacteroidales bacterium]|nr:hypothetical protein [Bacteroidales bacterium]MBR0290500.1 hypothetical protein [Bacteroidales bacterium]
MAGQDCGSGANPGITADMNDKAFHFVSVLIADAKVEGFPHPSVINISKGVDDFS